jgi:hypothetical protein
LHAQTIGFAGGTNCREFASHSVTVPPPCGDALKQEIVMQKFVIRILALLLAAAVLAGCADAVRQESAIDWMKRQPTTNR